MSLAYLGEIRMFAGNFAPNGWRLCDGSLLSIEYNEALFSLIGTTYGGDGETTFALPDLRGRLPIHMGNGHTLASMGGSEQVTLTAAQIPSHTHPLMASASPANSSAPSNQRILAGSGANQFYATGTSRGFVPVNMSPQAAGSAGGNQPHDNMQPYLCVNFIIYLYGIFPSQT